MADKKENIEVTSAARLSVAPMIDWTTRHCRYFHRLIAPRALLYTEMITSGAIIHGGCERFLAHDPAEHPLALQLGGSDPRDLHEATRLAGRFSFDEINLNVGCPSDRVQSGRFGACLMAEPDLVADIAGAMIEATDAPVTIKTRIGIDNAPVPDMLFELVDKAARRGVRRFIVHARQAWLKGLSPKENREIPPLRHGIVHDLKRRYPDLAIIVNGGIASPEAALRFVRNLDGVMIGRKAYHEPMSLAAFERTLFREAVADPMPSPHEIVRRMADYAGRQCDAGTPVRAIARHMLGLFAGRRGARSWRRHLGERMHEPTAGPEILLDAAAFVSEDETHEIPSGRQGEMACP